VATPRARQKIKQYFSALEEEELLVRGRSVLTKEIQREGHGQVSIDDLATRLGFKNAEALFIATGRGEVGPRAIQVALRGAEAVEPEGAEAEVAIGHSHAGDAGDMILIVGVGKLMTSLGRCCKPAPPDAIQGYVTRGRGVSIHRVECRISRRSPARTRSASSMPSGAGCGRRRTRSSRWTSWSRRWTARACCGTSPRCCPARSST
jgi:GTP pyrophosphokinase